MFRRVERALVAGVSLLACLACFAQQPEVARPIAASAEDFDVKFGNNEILVRRKGTDQWQHSRDVKESIKIELPDGGPVYLCTRAIKRPKPKRTPDPTFPSEAKDRHSGGLVAMHVVVDENGAVRSPVV